APRWDSSNSRAPAGPLRSRRCGPDRGSTSSWQRPSGVKLSGSARQGADHAQRPPYFARASASGGVLQVAFAASEHLLSLALAAKLASLMMGTLVTLDRKST